MLRAQTLAVLGDIARPVEETRSTGISDRESGMESPGLAACWGLGGKPGGERGGDRGDWGARVDDVRGDLALGTEGAGLGAALVGVGGAVSPLS